MYNLQFSGSLAVLGRQVRRQQIRQNGRNESNQMELAHWKLGASHQTFTTPVQSNK